MQGVGEDDEEEDEEEEDGVLTNSPEPPEAAEPDEMVQTDDSGQSGLLHPEQGLPHIFRVGVGRDVQLLSAAPHRLCLSAASRVFLSAEHPGCFVEPRP